MSIPETPTVTPPSSWSVVVHSLCKVCPDTIEDYVYSRDTHRHTTQFMVIVVHSLCKVCPDTIEDYVIPETPTVTPPSSRSVWFIVYVKFVLIL